MRMNWNRKTRVMKMDIEVEGDILYNIKKHEPYLDID